MSQQRNTLAMIDKEAGLKGYVLRPLSARLMDVTIPEKEGLIDRDKLFAFNGRSRRPQMALAEEFGLTDYPAPAGGCLLTEPNYSYRLKELLHHTPDPSLKDLHLLRVGRHFRLSSTSKAIVGRNERENGVLESFADAESYVLRVEGVGSPVVFLSGAGSGNFIPLAASLCARYSDAKDLIEVEVMVSKAEDSFKIQTTPANSELIEAYRIEKAKRISIKT